MLGRLRAATEWLTHLDCLSFFSRQKHLANRFGIVSITCILILVQCLKFAPAFGQAEAPVAKANLAKVLVELSASNAEVPIKIDFTEVDESTTWKLYVSSFNQSIEGAKLLKDKTSITETSFTWNTSSFAEATYYVFAVLERRGEKEIFYSNEAIVVDRSPRPGNRSPFVKINNPDESNLILSGQPIRFEFQSLDTEGDALTYQLMYKCTGQDDWVIAIENLIPEEAGNNGLRYEWTPAGQLPESSRCQVRIAANDGDKVGFGLTKEQMGMANTEKNYDLIKPILDQHCINCHSGEDPASNFVVTSENDIPVGQDNRIDGLRRKLNNVIEYINLPVEEEKHMPRFSRQRDRNPNTPKGYFLKQEEIELLELYRLTIERND